jgi:hypothetical protein
VRCLFDHRPGCCGGRVGAGLGELAEDQFAAVAGDGCGVGGALPGGGERGLGVVAAEGGEVREVNQPFSGDDGARAQFGDGQAAVRRVAGRGEIDGDGVQ